MYYCRECQNTFDDVDYIWSKSEFWGATYTDMIEVCPYCKNEDIINIENHPRCSCCHEICIDNYIKTEDDRCYCEDCYLPYSIDD